MPDTQFDTDLLIVGAGAAGLAAAIFAAEAAKKRGEGEQYKITLLEGAQKPGAKILVSGGGRCNVTNETVTPDDFWGGPRPMIRSVLRAFDNRRTLEWFQSLGVELKLEPTGKYFPVTNSARTVLDALLNRVRELGVEFITGVRADKLKPLEGGGFELTTKGDPSRITGRRVVLATGGQSLPKSGSDGWGLHVARRLGHSIVPPVPALVPLVLDQGESISRRLMGLSGLAHPMRLCVVKSNGKRLTELEGPTLFTHFGLSGPGAMDISRHLLRARKKGEGEADAAINLSLGHPAWKNCEAAELWLNNLIKKNPKRRVIGILKEFYPERMAGELAAEIECAEMCLSELPKPKRRGLARMLAAIDISVKGARGWSFAETTAGGVDLREIDIRTMESRIVPGLHICGEMLDVDGRIGGFNFQWAWASGYLAGYGAIIKHRGTEE